MEVLVFVDYEPFAFWADQPVKKRDEAYYQLKQKISEGIISFIEDRFPGFRKLIEYYELGTPLTNVHYTAHAFGNVYGIPGVPERYRSNSISYRTPVKNLFLTGADTDWSWYYRNIDVRTVDFCGDDGDPFPLDKNFCRSAEVR